ncbi:MAG: ATPase [Campylobacteraceae bacterium]|nr:ATPase [Campylobacteraceae bacterium]
MDQYKLEALFSKVRLSSYEDEIEHKNNFLLIQKISAKLGLVEIITRNKVASILAIYDNTFISRQTFGYWAAVINQRSIHNKLLCLDNIDFRKYSPSNRKVRLKNYYKVRICYDLLTSIRNRAFHFENLFKTNAGLPRISTLRNSEIIGIMPNKIAEFLDDIIECFEPELRQYL